MSERPGVDNLMSALNVRTQALRGFAVGVIGAAAIYYLFVIASGGSPYNTLFLVALALVLAFTLGLLATFVFTVGAAVRVSRTLD